MKNKRYFPLYVDLSDKNIVVVGCLLYTSDAADD